MTTELLLWYDDEQQINVYLLRKHKWNERTKTWDFIPCSNVYEVRYGENDEVMASTTDAMVAFMFANNLIEANKEI